MPEEVTTGRKLTLRVIRKAVQCHNIAFPSQVPVFLHLPRPDIQWRIVLLYFVHAWPVRRIASRYKLTKERIIQILRQWTYRALSLGYLGRIPTERECVYHLVMTSWVMTEHR
jgi:hypothetical protein